MDFKTFKDKTDHLDSIGALFNRIELKDSNHCIECKKCIESKSSKFAFLDPDKIVCIKCFNLIMKRSEKIP